MKLTKVLAIIFLLFLIPAKSFADAPEISAEQKYFNVIKGHYVLKGNVNVGLNNRGLKAKISADEARVSLLGQKCWATGKVTFVHDNVVFGCDKAFLQWSTKTADVVGAVKFESKDTVSITADSATFNWSEKIADFYGAVNLKPEENLSFAEDIELEDVTYAHVQFNVRENKILVLEKVSDVAGIEIPDSDVDVEQ